MNIELLDHLAKWEQGELTAAELRGLHGSDVDDLLDMHSMMTAETAILAPNAADSWARFVPDLPDPPEPFLQRVRSFFRRPLIAGFMTAALSTSGAYAAGMRPHEAVTQAVQSVFGQTEEHRSSEEDPLLSREKQDRQGSGDHAKSPGSPETELTPRSEKGVDDHRRKNDGGSANDAQGSSKDDLDDPTDTPEGAAGDSVDDKTTTPPGSDDQDEQDSKDDDGPDDDDSGVGDGEGDHDDNESDDDDSQEESESDDEGDDPEEVEKETSDPDEDDLEDGGDWDVDEGSDD